jgi:putative transposase
VKLKFNGEQEAKLEEWLWRLQAVWNWAVRKIELDGRDGVRYSSMEFRNQLAGHSKKIEIPSHTIQGVLRTAHDAWVRCYKGIGGRPRLKGRRNRLTSIPFPDPIRRSQDAHIRLQGVGLVRFHKQWLPEGAIKCGRLVKKASGWHLCLFIDAEPKAISITGDGQIGIDPGYRKESLLTLSTGEKIAHPKELEKLETRLGQAQRGKRLKLAARIQERIANQRRDRNHKLSRRLVSENAVIVFSKDKIKDIAQRGRGPVHFGKHVASAAHYQLRQMLAYKCSRTGGRSYIEVDGRDSTMTCSNCGTKSGPVGLSGLAVRQWRCKDCGGLHDRDINAAMNTLRVGVGATP